MQKFDTPAPISAVLDIPAGRVQFIAADRADTTVEVRPADASNGRDVKAAEQTTAVLRRRRSADRGPGEAPDPRHLRIRRGDGPAARGLPGRGEGSQRRVPHRRTARRRHLRRPARHGQDRRGRDRPPHRARRRRVGRPPGRRRGDPHRQGATSGSPRPCAARSCCAPRPARSRSAPPPESPHPWTPAPVTAGFSNALKNTEGTAGLTIHATTTDGDITARSL